MLCFDITVMSMLCYVTSYVMLYNIIFMLHNMLCCVMFMLYLLHNTLYNILCNNYIIYVI